MNVIKLPVTATSSGIFVDAQGKWVQSDDVAAALNAAPTRAFSDLTLAELHRIIDEDIADPESMVGDASTLLRRLQAFAAPVVPEGWQLVPIEADRSMRREIGDYSVLHLPDKIWREALRAAPTAPLRSESAVRAEARLEALEEAARAAENCDSPFSCPSDEQYEAVDLMARRIADTIRALIDQT